MYFKEKEDTNIDSEFENNKTSIFKFDFKKLIQNPKFLIIGGIVLLAIIIVIVIISLLGNSNKYTLELQGDKTITILLGSDYIEPGYKAYDKKGNDYTNQVEITSTVDTSKVGEYEVLYSIDSINEVRYIVVTDMVDETYIRLLGEVNMCLEVGKKYNEPGYEVYDSIEQNLTDKVKVTGSVDSSKEGTYQKIYSVVNSRNVTTTVVRYVYVSTSCQK